MKVKQPSQMTPMDTMQMMSDPSAWGYYDLWNVDPLGVVGPESPDSDSDQEDASLSSPPMSMMSGYPSGTPADIATSMAVASMAGLPPPGGFTLDDMDVTAPLSNTEKDVLNELVQELGLVSGQNMSVNLPAMQGKGAGAAAMLSAPSSVSSSRTDGDESISSKPSVIVTVKEGSERRDKQSRPSTSRIKKERPVTPDLDDILAKPVKSQKPVDVEAVMERNRKNAIQARINRQKKKQQVDLLEDEISQLQADKRTLQVKCAKQEEEKGLLRQEIVYLRSVLANQSMLAGLLKNINHTEGLELKCSSLGDQKRSAENGGEPSVKRKKLDTGSTAGICLHVDKDLVSLEFCEKCAQMAKTTPTANPSFSSQ